jgi:acid phosphatase (class A)
MPVMSLFFRAAFIGLLLTTGSASSPLPAKAADDGKLLWLTPEQEQSLIAALPPAPLPGSPVDQADLAAVLQAQANRTPQQVAQVLAEAHVTPKLFQVVLGPQFSPEREPKSYQLIVNAAHDTGILQRDAKDKWKRPRPFRAHAEVHPVYPADGLSYPSGHATFAYTCALLLAEIFPDKKDALLKEAAQIAQDRVIGGVHYPSDIAAGQKFGRAFVQVLLANPDFQAALGAAKKEVAAPSAP